MRPVVAPAGGGARIWAIAGCLVIAVLAYAKREAPRPRAVFAVDFDAQLRPLSPTSEEVRCDP